MASTTRKWGIITTVSGLQAGIAVNAIDWNESVETGEARNELGEVTDIAGFSKRRTGTVTGVVDTANGTLATAGSSLTIGGKDYLVTSVAQKESNTAFVEVTLTVEGADNAVITVVPSSSSSSSSSN